MQSIALTNDYKHAIFNELTRAYTSTYPASSGIKIAGLKSIAHISAICEISPRNQCIKNMYINYTCEKCSNFLRGSQLWHSGVNSRQYGTVLGVVWEIDSQRVSDRTSKDSETAGG